MGVASRMNREVMSPMLGAVRSWIMLVALFAALNGAAAESPFDIGFWIAPQTNETLDAR